MPVNITNASTDRVVKSGTIAPPDAFSFYCWFRRASTTLGEIFSFSASGIDRLACYWDFSSADLMKIERTNVAGTTVSRWQVTQANLGITLSASKWFFLAITQSASGTAPLVYTFDPTAASTPSSRTVSTTLGPGTADTSTAVTLHFGNWSGFDYAFPGDMAWIGMHNVALTAGEISEAAWRGMTYRGQIVTSPLEDSTHLYDLSGNDATLTGTGLANVTNAPPVIPLWMSDPAGGETFHAAASPPATTTYRRTLLGVGV